MTATDPKQTSLNRTEIVLKFTNWKDIAELTGIVAIVASLLFVGLQLKQSQEIAIAAQYQERFSAALQVMSDRQLDENYVRIYGERLFERYGAPKGVDSDMSADAYGLRYYDARIFFLIHDNLHFQYISGFLTEESWSAYRAGIKSAMRDPVFRNYHANEGFRMRESFRDLVEQLRIEGESASQ